VLGKCPACLKENGGFIVRMSDRGKYGFIVRIIEQDFSVIERYLAQDTKAIILVFKPHEK